MEKFMPLCAHLIRHNCSKDISDLIHYALGFQKEASHLKRETVDQAIEISRLKAENEFLRRTLEESENTD